MRNLSRVFFATALASLVGCGGPSSTDECTGGKCDDVLEGDDKPLESPCADALFDRSGRGFLPERLADDALIKHVYSDDADGCPVTMREIMEVLKKNDDKDCVGDDGLVSHVISEQAQQNDSSKGASYRLITSRTCNDRKDFGLLFSLFGFADVPQLEGAGLHPAGDAFPDGVEIIAFDEANGVFNYYKEVGGKMGFFGSSTDFVGDGPGGPNLTDVRGCANCHTGGGLIMKELENPWLHWEEIPDAGFTDFERRSPGAFELIDNRSDVLGVTADGPSLEQNIIKPGNEAWTERRIKFMNANRSVADLLRPLFCPVEVNIGAHFNARRVNHSYLVDKSLLSSVGLSDSGRINTERADYENMLRIAGSQVSGSDKPDVRLPMAFVQRAHADIHYVRALIDNKLITREFADDVLMVDFTRQVFSDDRCDLLEFAPDLPTEERDPDSIRDGFLTNLADADDGTPAAQLLANLQARVDGATINHNATISSFLSACEDRQRNDQFASTNADFEDLLGASEFHIDAVKLRSLGRKMAMRDGALDGAEGSAQHRFEVFEFPDSMPSDDINVRGNAGASNPLAVHPEARFSPLDCSLEKEFVFVEGNTGPTPSTGCPDACGVFINGASCQCDTGCVEFGNCCDGWEPVLEACPGDPFEFVNGADCQCDDQCTDFGNCCDGWEPLCLPGD